MITTISESSYWSCLIYVCLLDENLDNEITSKMPFMEVLVRFDAKEKRS